MSKEIVQSEMKNRKRLGSLVSDPLGVHCGHI